MNRLTRLLALLFFLTVLPLAAQELTYKPGGGVSLTSAEAQWRLRLLGYIQNTYTVHTRTENDAISNEFFIRRARLDIIFDYRDRYQIFFELDARGSRTEMVLAQFDVRYFGPHSIRFGKYITPFSPENTRSSRSLTTVERYSGLNAMFLLPALDTQYGIMFFGAVSPLTYYLSVSNGNGKASQNLREDNDAKDVQGRLVLALSSHLKAGVSGNYADESPQALPLVDHTFNSFNRAAIGGKRYGWLADMEYQKLPFLLRGEVFQYRFDAPLSETQQVDAFLGGYGEVGWFLYGDYRDGLQLIGRVETARYGDTVTGFAGPTRLVSYLVGNDWYRDGVFRLQVNLIYESADAPSPLADSRFTGHDDSIGFLSMLQLKF